MQNKSKYVLPQPIKGEEGFQGEESQPRPDSREEDDAVARLDALASEIAQGLKDTSRIDFYRRIVRRYPERALRLALAYVRSVPADEITVARAAYFTWLVRNLAGKPQRLRLPQRSRGNPAA